MPAVMWIGGASRSGNVTSSRTTGLKGKKIAAGIYTSTLRMGRLVGKEIKPTLYSSNVWRTSTMLVSPGQGRFPLTRSPGSRRIQNMPVSVVSMSNDEP